MCLFWCLPGVLQEQGDGRELTRGPGEFIFYRDAGLKLEV